MFKAFGRGLHSNLIMISFGNPWGGIMKVYILLLLSISLIFSSCKKSNDSGNRGPVNSNGDPIIGDKFKDEELVFPNNTPMFMVLIRLKSPALLSTVQRNASGEFEVDKDLQAQILKEQQAFEDQLKNLSSEISVLYRYKMVLNALASQAPQSLAEEISQLPLDFIEADESFALPQTFASQVEKASRSLAMENTMTFIGATRVHDQLSVSDESGQIIPVRGQGIKVGIIDSGIDYTHKMLGGSGSISDFETLDPSGSTSLFPNHKVVGGYDFAGVQFEPNSHLYVNRIPVPDSNPIDRTGHGTHVAGTVAGIGDGVNTYDGAAPDAELYALKVFGDNPDGGTSDSVIIAALEYAADPNGDMDLSDKLDVVNLSLGVAFGKPHSLYNQAISNLVNGGVVTVAAAGNAGPVNSIVGSPSTADDAISVAGSVDNMPHNWQFDGVEFHTVNQPKTIVETIEGKLTVPIQTLGPVSGELFYIGLADKDLEVKQAELLNGKVALIDRGNVSFVDKVERAYQAGAIGIVMVNNEPGNPIYMDGDKTFPIPGVMISQSLGSLIKEDMKAGPATVDFISSEKFKRPEYIDLLAPFSSQGPRDLDSAIKPEITAPGYNIISARVGSGDQAVMNSGTSMSAPHIAGVAALLVQYRKDLQARDIKSLMMNTSVLIDDDKGNVYPVSRQGAGRIDAYKAATTPLVFSEPGISLGKLNVGAQTHINREFQIFNDSQELVQFELSPVNHENLQVNLSTNQFQLEPGERRTVSLDVVTLPPAEESLEVDAQIAIKKSGELIGHIPLLGVVNRTTNIKVDELIQVNEDSFRLSLSNVGDHDGYALLFNHLGNDERKNSSLDLSSSVACDLQSAGYRILEKEGKPVMQVGIKLYNPLTAWSTCDINLEIDTDGDGSVDREVYAGNNLGLPGLQGIELPPLSTLVFDAKVLSQIVQDYNKVIATQPSERPPVSFAPALIGGAGMLGFSHSTVALIEVPLETLNMKTHSLEMRVSVTFNGVDVIDRNDYLGEGLGEFLKIDTTLNSGTFAGIPEIVPVPAGQIVEVDLLKAQGEKRDLLVYYPRNEFTVSVEDIGKQGEVVTPNKNVVPVP